MRSLRGLRKSEDLCVVPSIHIKIEAHGMLAASVLGSERGRTGGCLQLLSQATLAISELEVQGETSSQEKVESN